MVVVRDGRKVRFRNFDVVPEDPVESDLQVRDAGPRTLRFLHLGDLLPPALADRPQLVQLRIGTRADALALPRQGGRVIGDRRLDGAPEIRQIVEFAEEAQHERRAQVRQDRAEPRDHLRRLLERREIARPGGAERGPRDEPFEIRHMLQRVS